MRLRATGNAEQEEPDEHRQLVGLADAMQVGRQLGRPQQEVVAGREPLLDSFRFCSPRRGVAAQARRRRADPRAGVRGE